MGAMRQFSHTAPLIRKAQQRQSHFTLLYIKTHPGFNSISISTAKSINLPTAASFIVPAYRAFMRILLEDEPRQRRANHMAISCFFYDMRSESTGIPVCFSTCIQGSIGSTKTKRCRLLAHWRCRHLRPFRQRRTRSNGCADCCCYGWSLRSRTPDTMFFALFPWHRQPGFASLA